MAYLVKKKETGRYLMSPDVEILRGKPDALWQWSWDEKDAHHFADRAEAKETLRSIVPPSQNLVSQCTFYKV